MSHHAAIQVQSTVTSKGQTTVPKELRDALGIKEGTPLRWKLENGVLTVRPKTRRLENFVPLAPPNGKHLTVEEMDEAIGEAVAERDRRAKG
ncbi:AbrB/MazE/SpoVT family DNA-binding domain-containing protein [Devosia sp.]|uniref:AbrB/MazE/SpoVT family DNA-binding domain-containing protein n=1 Tax=Devosia sp. TaxID=1871048 RepID=UPI001AD54C5B|nr:AbrB/MazE/SpoVT family DNA-binding domain-containing protein [Devosia sp.]MBN9308945.1 AbrB/MazE/SpoVT family DNA-binding domain-containing protein [Devosia sp.]